MRYSQFLPIYEVREVGFVQNNVDIASISATMEPVEVSLESIPSSSRPVSLSPTKKVRNWIGKIPERFSPKKSPRKQGIITKPTEAQSKNDEPQETAPFSPVAAGAQKNYELQERAPFLPPPPQSRSSYRLHVWLSNSMNSWTRLFQVAIAIKAGPWTRPFRTSKWMRRM